jgi:hypothetical protein
MYIDADLENRKIPRECTAKRADNEKPAKYIRAWKVLERPHKLIEKKHIKQLNALLEKR